MAIKYPQVTRAAVDGFLKVYNRGGLHLLFDDQSRQAMVDFTNVALRSYVDELVANAKAAQSTKVPETPQVNHAVPSQVNSAPSKIILTD